MNRFVIATALAGSLIACSDESTNSQLTDQDVEDIAVATAALVTDDGGEIEGMSDGSDLAEGSVPGILTGGGTGDWTGRRGQLSYEYSIDCKDINGESQDFCDSETDEASLAYALSGEIETDRRYALLDRSINWVLSGLTTDTVVFNGSGQYTKDSEFMALDRPVMRSFAFDYAATYNAVTFDRTVRRPVGGSITYAVTANRTEARRFRDIEASFDVTVTVTFSPDDRATIVVDGDRSYEVTLSSGEVVEN